MSIKEAVDSHMLNHENHLEYLKSRRIIMSRPIIMGAESVLAILEGRKTQTRRVINPRKYNIAGWDMPRTKEDMEAGYPFAENADGDSFSVVDWCPYGRIGDRLYVKETWAKCPDGGCLYKADPMFIGCDKSDFAWDWKSPMFMPRWASRITLEITDIRVEMVQDITPEDALKEGFCNYGTDVDTLDAFCEAWQKLNAKRGYPWKNNDWVWVISFKVVGEQ